MVRGDGDDYSGRIRRLLNERSTYFYSRNITMNMFFNRVYTCRGATLRAGFCMRAACALFSWSLIASAQTVRIGGSTPTQAVMLINGYTGPCTIEVSTSPNFVPLVPDINGTEYLGA